MTEFVSFGAVGKEEIDDAEYYILISPQNIVGTCVRPLCMHSLIYTYTN